MPVKSSGKSVENVRTKKPAEIKAAVNKPGAKIADKKKPEVKKGVFFFNLFIASVVIICLFSAFNNYIKINQRNERLEILETEHNSLRIKNDALRNRLETSREIILDEDYVINFARANGLRRDNEILFYLYPEQ